MIKQTLKNFLLEYGLITEVSEDWKKDFMTGAKGMPKTTPEVINYVENIYFTAFGGESNVQVINKKMAKWLVEQITILGGPTNVGTDERNKMLVVMTWFKIAGSEGNLPKMDLNSAFEFSKKKLDEKYKKDELSKTQTQTPALEEPPLTKVEEEGLVKRVHTVPDGSGRFWVKVNPDRAGEFFDRLCDDNGAFGVGCQSVHSGMMHSEHRKKDRNSYTLLGPKKGQKLPISTIMALSIRTGDDEMPESKQVGNQPIGTNYNGWSDLYEVFIDFLATPIAKNTIAKSIDTYSFSWLFGNKRFDLLNKLDSLRPDFVEESKYTIIQCDRKAASEWFETRSLDAVEALKKYGEKIFIENINNYTKSATFKDAIRILVPNIPDLCKKYPDAILPKINYFLDFLPVSDFQTLISSADLNNFILHNTSDFELLLKKLTNVNSKDAKVYKEIFTGILDNYFEIISRVYGKGLIGVKKLMGLLEMPKSDKHQFVRKNPDGSITALRKDVQREGGIETSQDVEFDLPETLAVTTKKERRDLLKKNESFIKSLVEGDEERKDINFLRMIFGETNPQDIQRTLKSEKDKFIKYYNDPNHATKFNQVRGVTMPGIFEFYRIFNKGTVTGQLEGKEKPYYKFDLEDIRNPEIAKQVIGFYAKLYKADEKTEIIDAIGQYNIMSDYIKMLSIAGESNEKVREFLSKYKPTELGFYKGKPTMIPLTVYRKYYSLLSEYVSSDEIKNEIKVNENEIVSKLGRVEYEKLLGDFSKFSYEVEVGDFVEFLGPEGDTYLDKGRKYNVVDVSAPEDSGNTLKGQIEVMDNRKKRSGWLDTKLFKVPMKRIDENAAVRNHIKKVLAETLFKS